MHDRFRTAGNSNAVDKLSQLVSPCEGLNFPNTEKLRVPVRNTADGEVISGGSLAQLALENTLVNVADWYTMVRFSVRQLRQLNRTIAFAGFGNFIPSSLVQDPGLQIISLSNLEGSEPRLRKAFVNGHGEDNANEHENCVNDVYKNQEIKDLSQYPPHSIAIVGMAGGFPGADSIDELWDLILEGMIAIESIPIGRLGLPQAGGHANTKW